MRKEVIEEFIELWPTDHVVCSTFLPHLFIHGLNSKRAGKVDDHFVRHVVSNSVE